jgi:Flp pilus assembly protein TadB
MRAPFSSRAARRRHREGAVSQSVVRAGVPDPLAVAVATTPEEQRRSHNVTTRTRRLQDAAAVNTIYRGCMGKLLLVVLAVIAAFMILSIVISALHFIFWVAVVALIVVVGMRLTGGARRRSQR